MVNKLQTDGCLYQDDVVDYIIKNGDDSLLRENADGNIVLDRPLLNNFKKSTSNNVVWVQSDFYWRYRVAEDQDGRKSRG